MVAGRSFLIIILLLLLPVLAVAQGICQKCHSSHYVEAGGCTLCHRGDPRTDRQELAHHDLIAGRFSWFAIPESPVTQSGAKLLEKAGCRRCHRSGDKGNTLASDLDRLLPAARPQEVLQSIRQPVLFMPDFAFTEATAVTLVNALFAHSAQAEKPTGETPLVVHFEGVERAENAFDKHCGGCHRLLTRRWGGLGSGLVGPNLSGLTSEFYPVPFREGEPWTAERLKKWLENPRAVRPQARMRPQLLEPAELTRVLEIVSPALSAEQPVENFCLQTLALDENRVDLTGQGRFTQRRDKRDEKSGRRGLDAEVDPVARLAGAAGTLSGGVRTAHAGTLRRRPAAVRALLPALGGVPFRLFEKQDYRSDTRAFK